MCAIAGLLGTVKDQVGLIRAMTRLMSHRGPDDEGFLFVGPAGVQETEPSPSAQTPNSEPFLCLGHRRLAILDRSRLGHQPMCYRGRYWIVYNGEVYNYLELRAELEHAGHQFISHCDTEVLLAAYAQWGVDAFPRFNGMWALAIYDQQTGQLVLSRDRFGVKPLYFWQTAGFFAFASEIKAFTCLPHWRPRLNGQAVHDFLLSGLQDHSGETFFAGVFQLTPGCFARLDCQAWRQTPSTQLPPKIEAWYQVHPKSFDGTFEEAAVAFRDLLLDSVRLRLRADVPVGSCLSGGLDSSSIVCATHRLLPGHKTGWQKTFSACSELERFDERRFIEPVVKATQVDSHYVFPNSTQLFDCLEKLTWHQDEPFAGTSIFAQWCVFEMAARQEIKVMLDGQGADELLCGYNDFRRAFYQGLVRSGRWRLAWREVVAGRGSTSRGLTAFARALLDALVPLRMQRAFRGQRGKRAKPRWLNAARLEASFPGRLAGRFRQNRSARDFSLELLSGAHLQMLLHWEDRNSMAHSVEARVPFLDYRLVEFVTGLPDDFKIKNGKLKAVLRLGMKEIVPDPILQRTDKMGFVTAEEVWARENGGATFRRRLHEAVDACQGVVSSEALTCFEDCFTGHADYDSAIWRIIALGTWMRVFGVQP